MRYLLLLFLTTSLCGRVVINEFMSSNGTVIADEDGDFSDWIELYNFGDEVINLAGWGLSDDLLRPLRWVFPEVILGPGDYLLVWASGKNRIHPMGSLHTNFSISAQGEPLLLTQPDGRPADQVPPVALPRDMSYGRSAQESMVWQYFTVPTPGSENHYSGYQGLLAPPKVLIQELADDDRIRVELSHDRADVAIYFTTDGTNPLVSGLRYQGPFFMALPTSTREGLAWIRTNPVETDAFWFGWREPLGPVTRVPVVRAVAVAEGLLDPDGMASTWIPADIKAEHYPLPIISLVVDPDDLFDRHRGIYVPGDVYYDSGYGDNIWGAPNANYFQQGPNWERKMFFQFREPDAESVSTSGWVGARIHGGGSRSFPQKSIRLYQRSDASTHRVLDYPFFGGNQPEAFESIILRNSGNDFEFALLRDAYIQTAVRHLGFATQAYRPAAVYINGEYWGLHNIRERMNLDFLTSNYGANPNDLDLLEFSGWPVAVEGSLDAYNELVSVVEAGADDPDFFGNEVLPRMDVSEYIRYFITQIFIDNVDWPGNNVKAWRSRSENGRDRLDGKFRWLMYDTDLSLGIWNQPSAGNNSLQMATAAGGMDWPNPDWSTVLFRNLLRNDSFRDLFVRTFFDHLNTTFQPERMESILWQIASGIEHEIDRHIQRWTYPHSVELWQHSLDNIAWFVQRRPALQKEHLKAFFELADLVEVELVFPGNQAGYYRVNSVTLMPGGGGFESFTGSHWTGLYPRGTQIVVEAVPHHGYSFAGWMHSIEESPTITFGLANTVSLEAIFAEDPNSLTVQPHPLAQKPWTLTHWQSDAEAGSSPGSMFFPVTAGTNPSLFAVADDIWSLPYNLTARSRVVGLDEQGIGFINTGNAQSGSGFVMGAMLAVDTRDTEAVRIFWNSGTLIPNERVYGLRLQYRVGNSGPFRDLVDNYGRAIQYLRQDRTETQRMLPAFLPEEAINKPYVEIFWRYYDTGRVTSGARAMLNLDEILVAAVCHDLPITRFWLSMPLSSSGWAEIPALGRTFGTSAPWVYSEHFGWTYLIENDDGGALFWDHDLGWLFTHPSSFPLVLTLEGRGEWLYPVLTSGGSRWVYSLSTREWRQTAAND